MQIKILNCATAVLSKEKVVSKSIAPTSKSITIALSDSGKFIVGLNSMHFNLLFHRREGFSGE
jgi:hypothetical protein